MFLLHRQIVKACKDTFLVIANIISNISIPMLGIVDIALMGHLESDAFILFMIAPGVTMQLMAKRAVYSKVS